MHPLLGITADLPIASQLFPTFRRLVAVNGLTNAHSSQQQQQQQQYVALYPVFQSCSSIAMSYQRSCCAEVIPLSAILHTATLLPLSSEASS